MNCAGTTPAINALAFQSISYFWVAGSTRATSLWALRICIRTGLEAMVIWVSKPGWPGTSKCRFTLIICWSLTNQEVSEIPVMWARVSTPVCVSCWCVAADLVPAEVSHSAIRTSAAVMSRPTQNIQLM